MMTNCWLVVSNPSPVFVSAASAFPIINYTDFSFSTAVFISGFLLFIFSFSGITASSVIPSVMTTTCNVALWQTSTRISLKWQIQQLLLVHFIQWHLLSFRITRELLLNDSHFPFILILTIIHLTFTVTL